jgi:pyruvate dehydrogenase (quinone)
VDVLTSTADAGVPSVATLKPSAEIFASEEDIAEMARRIDDAGSIVIMWEQRRTITPRGIVICS